MLQVTYIVFRYRYVPRDSITPRNGNAPTIYCTYAM
jgi:hypothetical protein